MHLIERINLHYKTGISLDSQLDMFAPSLLGDELVDSSSLHGRISVLYHVLYLKTSVQDIVKLKVIEAFKQFNDSKPTLDAIPLNLRSQLERFCQLTPPSSVLTLGETLSLEESNSFAKEQANLAQLREKRAFLLNKTLFHDQRSRSIPVTPKIVNEWLSPGGKPTEEMHAFVTSYYPSCKEGLSAIRAGVEAMDTLQADFLKKAKETDIPEALEHCSATVFTKLNSLKPGESWLYCGSFGRKIDTAFSLAQLAYHTPHYMQTQISEETQELIQNLSEKTPENYIEENLSNELQKLVQKMPYLEAILNTPSVSLFFKNDQHKLPENFRNNLPPIYVEALEHLMHKGLLHSLFLFMPESSIKDIVEWVTQNHQELLSVANGEKLAKEFENQILATLLPFLTTAMGPLNQAVGATISTIRKVIPDAIIELAGLNEMLSGGPLWIEFKRTEADHFDLKIYGSKQTLSYHPLTINNNIAWPLCYHQVPLNSLSESFVSGLLSHALEPLLNPQMVSIPREIYNTLFRTLNILPAAPKPELNISTSDFGNSWDFMFNFMIPSEKKSHRNYLMTKEILLGYIHTLRNADGTLLVNDLSVINTLKSLATVLHSEAKNADISKAEIEKIEDTLTWIQFEKSLLEKAKSQEKSPQLLFTRELKESLHKMLKDLNISSHNYAKCKEDILWAFGDDALPLFDLIWNDLHSTPLTSAKAAEPTIEYKESRGWFRDTLHRLHSRLVYNTYRFAMGLTREKRAEEYAVFSYAQAAHCLLVDFLPSPAKEWYRASVEHINKALREIAWKFLVHTLQSYIGEEGLNNIHALRHDFHRQVKALLVHTNPSPKLELDVSNASPLQKKIEWKTATSLESVSSYTTQKVTPRVLSLVYFPQIPFPENPAHLLSYLAALETNALDIWYTSNEARQNYLMTAIGQWPVPNESTIWDKVEDPEKIIEAVWSISTVLNRYETEDKNTFYLCNFHMLAVLDNLARRVDPHLEGLTVMAHEFSYIYTQYIIHDLEEYQKFCQLKNYLLPDYDFNANRETLGKQAKKYLQNVLFFFDAELFTIASGKPDKTFKKDNKDLLNTIFKTDHILDCQEGIYYQRLTAGKKAKDIFPVIAPPHYFTEDPVVLVRILENESYILQEKNSIIPRSFALLKRQALVCATMRQNAQLSRRLAEQQDLESEWFTTERTIPPAYVEKKGFFSEFFNLKTFIPQSFAYGKLKNNPGEWTGIKKDTFNEHTLLAKHERSSPINSYNYQIQLRPQILKDALLHHIEMYQLYKDRYISAKITPDLIGFFTLYRIDKEKYSFDTISRIVEIVDEMILTSNEPNWFCGWIQFGISLQKVEPLFKFDKPLNFPNYRNLLYDSLNDTKGDGLSVLWSTIALTFPNTSSGLPLNEKKEGVFAILMAFFMVRYTNFLAGKLAGWSSDIDDLLHHGLFANTFGHYLTGCWEGAIIHPDGFKLYFRNIPPNNIKKYVLKNKFHSIDLYNGTIEINTAAPSNLELVKIQNVEKDVIPNIIKQGKDNFIFKQKQIDGRTYLKCSAVMPKEIKYIRPDKDGEVEVWQEETENALKHFYIDGGCSFYVENTSEGNILKKIIYKGEHLIPIDPNTIQSQLAPILRVCTIETVECWMNEKTGILKHIIFDNPHLHIEVIQIGNTHKAFLNYENTQYALSDKDIPELDTIHVHLKLERSAEDVFVLIPKNQFVSSLLQRGMENLAPQIACLVRELATKQQKNEHIFFKNHYSYSVRDGGLESRNPLALAYLGSLFLLQGRTALANKYYEKIIFLSRQKHIPRSVFTELLPLLIIPAVSDECSDTRRRLFSALGRNEFTHPEKKEDLQKDDRFTAIASLVGICDWVLMQNLPKDQRLEDDEEWFLYKFGINNLMSIFKKGEIYTDLERVLTHISPELILNSLFITTELSKRLKTLNKKFGIKESILEKGINLLGAINSAKASSDVTEKLISGFSSIKMPSLETPDTLVWETTWSKYISELCTHAYVRQNLFKSLFHQINPKATEVDLTLKGLRQKLIPNFITYYQYIVDDEIDETLPFIALLKQHRSGWSETSRVVIHILLVAHAHKNSCFSALKLREIWERPGDDAKKEIEFSMVLQEIVKKPYFWLAASFAKDNILVPLTKNVLMNTALAPILAPLAALKPLLAYKRNIDLGLQACSVAKNIYDIHFKAPKALPSTRTKIAPTGLSALDEVDQKIEAAVTLLYETAFIEKVYNDPHETCFTLFHGKIRNDADTKKFKHINKSITDYYSRKRRIPPQNLLRNLECLWNVYMLSKSFLEELENQLKARTQDVLEVLNPLYLSEYPTITLKEWQQKIHDEDLEQVQLKLKLSPEELDSLVVCTTACLVYQSRIHQFNKIVKLLDTAFIAFEQNEGSLFAQQIEALGMELQVRRAYTFTSPKIPFRLAYRFLMYECSMKRILWEKQVKVFSKQLMDTHPHVCGELMPGRGKTELGLSLQQSFFANGELIPHTSVPAQHAKTHFRFISKQKLDVYGLKDYTLTISRDQRRTWQSYQGLRVTMIGALENRLGINEGKKDSQSLELEFLTKCHDSRQRSSIFSNSKVHEKSLEELKEILLHKKFFEELLLDECHEENKQNRETIHPVGKKEHLHEDLQNILLKTLQAFVNYPGVLEALKQNKLKTLQNDYVSTIIPAVIEKLCNIDKFQIDSVEKKQEFINYLKDQKAPITDFIADHPHWREIATIRGVLTVIIAKILPQRINVQFGVIKDEHLTEKAIDEISNKGLIISQNACPFKGANEPMFGYNLKSPYDDFVKTYFSYLHNGLNELQVCKIISLLIGRAKKESSSNKKVFQKTVAAIYFSKICPHITLDSIKDEICFSKPSVSTSKTFSTNLEPLFNFLKHHPSAVYLFVRYFVADDIKYWERSVHSNSTNYIDMFTSSIQQSGTPYNIDVYFPGINPLYDKGTLGEMLHLISNKCPEDGIKVLPNCSGVEALDSIIQEYFAPEKGFSLLVDGGPLFNGISNMTVASKLAAHCRAHLPHIQAIVFFDKETLVYMNVYTGVKRPFAECTLKPYQRITYIDDIRGFGTNVAQSGKALITFRDQPFYKVLQECFRLREIKEMITLILEGKAAEFAQGFDKRNTHEIHFVMLQDTAMDIKPLNGKIPSLKELLVHSIHVESDDSLSDNYEGYIQHLHNVIRRAILFKMLTAPNLAILLAIYAEFEDFLVPKTQVDPIVLFGWVLKEILATEAIEKTKDYLINIVKGKEWFNEEELKGFKEALEAIPKPPMQEYVSVLTNGKEIQTLINNDINKELYAEKETSLDTENCQAQEQEQEQKKENHLQNPSHSGTPFVETKWQMNYDPRSIEWVSSISHKNNTFNFEIFNGIKLKKNRLSCNVQTYSFAKICARSNSSRIHNISSFLDKRIWASHNFLPLTETLCTPFVSMHCNIHKVIIHLENVDGKDTVVSVGCLSRKEAKRWRTFIKRPPTSDAHCKIILYDLHNRLMVKGDDVDMDALRKDLDFKILEAQLLYLNGNLSLTLELQDSLRQWVIKHDVKKLYLASKEIAQRMPFQDYPGSDVDLLFGNLLDIPLEDLL